MHFSIIRINNIHTYFESVFNLCIFSSNFNVLLLDLLVSVVFLFCFVFTYTHTYLYIHTVYIYIVPITENNLIDVVYNIS